MTLMVNHLVGFGASEDGAGWTPQDLLSPGVAGAWYRVSDLGSVFEERTGGGSTPSVVGGPVGTIRDQSGNGHHLVAPSDTARGSLRQQGSAYYIEFDGVDDTYATTAAFSWGYPAFVAMAMAKAGDSTSVASTGFIASPTNYAGLNNVGTRSRIGAAHRAGAGSTGQANAPLDSMPGGSVKVVQAVLAANLATLQLDDTADITSAATVDPALFTGTPSIRIGSFVSRFYGGIFLINKAMSPSDRASARTWLGVQIGIVL